MAYIQSVRGFSPEFGSDCFLAENSTIVGDVKLGEHCSVWFNAVLRGDVGSIRIGDYSNVQDGAVIHATYQYSDTIIGEYVSIGHKAVVHGCEVKDHVLVGMGAIIMDRARIEPYCIIAAGAVVLENTVCEAGFIYAGVPAKKIKALTEEQKEGLRKTPNNYVLYSSWFKVDEISKDLE